MTRQPCGENVWWHGCTINPYIRFRASYECYPFLPKMPRNAKNKALCPSYGVFVFLFFRFSSFLCLVFFSSFRFHNVVVLYYYTLLYSAQLYLTLLYRCMLNFVPFHLNLFYFTLPHSIPLFHILFCFSLFFSVGQSFVWFTLLYSALFCSWFGFLVLVFFTLFFFALRFAPLFSFSAIFLVHLHSTLHCSTSCNLLGHISPNSLPVGLLIVKDNGCTWSCGRLVDPGCAWAVLGGLGRGSGVPMGLFR